MTNLIERFNNVLAELAIIEAALDKSSDSPPCCLTLYQDGKITCSISTPMEKEQFYRECKKCRERIRNFLDNVHSRNRVS